MKQKLIITLCTLLFAFTLSAQENIFEKFEDMKGVTTVYISPKMFGLIKNLNTSDVKIGSIIDKLSSLHLINSENKETASKLRNEIRNIGLKKNYEEILKVKEEDERISIYVKEGKKENEYVLLIDDKDEFTIMILKGKLTLEDIQNTVK